MKNVSETRFIENQNTHSIFHNYGIKWKNKDTARQVADDNIIRHMRFACWIAKGTDTHTHTQNT